MATYAKRHRPRKRYRLAEGQLDLFEWAEAQAGAFNHTMRPAPYPAGETTLAIRTIARRFGMPAHLARVVAELANVGEAA